MKQPQRSIGSLVVSIAVHLTVGAAILRVLMMPYPLVRLVRDSPVARSLPVERIGFVQLPQAAQPRPGRRGGDGRPERTTPTPPLVAPTATPAAVDLTPQPAPPPTPEGGSGPMVGAGGPARGVRPEYVDPRIWVPPAEVVAAPTTLPERMDSLILAGTRVSNDSMAQVASAARKGSDWTFERNGKKYGLDQQGLHIGDFTVPRFLLPTFQQGNLLYAARDRQLAMMRREIQENAQRAMNEDEFRKAVKAIRERKEREHERERERREPKREDIAGSGRG
ncbi:MAG: hypothetical protein NVS1B4_23610 [Gemmatimonadaceae bacterium]